MKVTIFNDKEGSLHVMTLAANAEVKRFVPKGCKFKCVEEDDIKQFLSENKITIDALSYDFSNSYDGVGERE